SSHAAIEAQFGLAAGSVSIAATVWAKNVKRTGTQPYRLTGQGGTKKTKPKKNGGAVTQVPAAPAPIPASPDKLTGFLRPPPVLDPLDEAELLGWSVEIVRAARRNGYL